MAQRIIATAAAAAIVDPNQVAISLRAKHFKGGGKPVISIEGLAGAETVSWWKLANGDWEEIDDGAGTQVAYTATYASDTFNGPGVYGFTKDITVGSITVTLDDFD
jgi:hypothetical protein